METLRAVASFVEEIDGRIVITTESGGRGSTRDIGGDTWTAAMQLTSELEQQIADLDYQESE